MMTYMTFEDDYEMTLSEMTMTIDDSGDDY